MEKKVKASKSASEEDKFVWSTEIVAELIEAVHQEPVIWDYRSPNYKERCSRYDGFLSVQKKMSHHSPELTADTCRAKWNNVKSYFQIILNNERKVQRSGSGFNKPSTWIHYQAMSFLRPTLSTTKVDENFKRPNPNSKLDAPSVHLHCDVPDEENDSTQATQVTELFQEAENREQQEETVKDKDCGSSLDLHQKPSQEQTSYSVPRIDHCARKKRKKLNDLAEDNVGDAVVKYLEEGKARRESRHQPSMNEKRGMIWGQEMDRIQDPQLRGQCIIKITTLIQETLMEDEEKRQGIPE